MMELDQAKEWMALAQQIAQDSAEKYGEVPVGAVLVKDGELIGQGTNGRLRTERTIAHAEILALEDYNKKFGRWRCYPGTTLVVTAEPCLMCTGALLWARVDNIFYGCEDPRGAGIRKIRDLIEDGTYDHRFKLVQGQVMADSNAQMMSHFFAKMRAQKANTSPN